MKSSYSGFPEGLPIMLEPSGPNFAPHPKVVVVTVGIQRRLLVFTDTEEAFIFRADDNPRREIEFNA